MEPSPILWSELQQQQLSAQLVGFWAGDVWDKCECPLNMNSKLETLNCKLTGRYLRFSCQSDRLNAELKYVFWQKLQRGEWSLNTTWHSFHSNLQWLTQWINTIAPQTLSLMEQSLTQWELSFRAYITEHGKLHRRRSKYVVSATGVQVHEAEDHRISTLRVIYKTLREVYDTRSEYDKEIWDMRKLGVSLNASRSQNLLNFTLILQPWLRQAIQAYLRYCLATQAGGTCVCKLKSLCRFSRFLSQRTSAVGPSDINRPLIVEYLGYLTAAQLDTSSKQNAISALRNFLELSAREGWMQVTEQRLVFDDDYPPRGTKLPRYIPQEVVEQLNQNLEALPPHIMNMVLILEETGRRIGEVCCMPFDCIKQDTTGDWFLFHYQSKLRKEDSIPISRELVAVIQEQQKSIVNEWGPGFPYLFPAPKPQGKGQPISYGNFSQTLKRLAHERQICDASGQVYNFQTHQFRHTVGTNMINNGVPIHLVQRYLGHTSIEMTLCYAHIHDQTLKREIAKFHGRIVNIAGQVIESTTPELDTSDLQWFKRNVLGQALPNGSCARPVIKGNCPHPNACLACGDFRTTLEFLNIHKSELEQTEQLIAKATENGWQRQLEMNQQVAINLRNIIHILEDQ
jgi:site-specific recombinase XerD